MSKRFNPDLLLENRLEVLILLMEECAEVAKECSKCIRGGFQFTSSTTQETFLDLLKKEIVDLKFIIAKFDQLEPTDASKEVMWRNEKMEKVLRWTDVFKPKFCPNCGAPTEGKIKVGNSRCNECVAVLHDENK